MPGPGGGEQRTQLTGAHDLIEETATFSPSVMRKVHVGTTAAAGTGGEGGVLKEGLSTLRQKG